MQQFPGMPIDELISHLKPGDRLIVSELSRLGRSTGEVIQLINQLSDTKVETIAIKQELKISAKNRKDMTSKVMVTIFSLLAELERDLISDRTKMALAQAKAAGKKLGRPKGAGKYKLDGREDEIKDLLSKGDRTERKSPEPDFILLFRLLSLRQNPLWTWEGSEMQNPQSKVTRDKSTSGLYTSV